MAKKVYQLNYGGHPVRYSFLYPQTYALLRPLPRLTAEAEPDVVVTQEMIDRVRRLFPADTTDSFLEYRCLIGLTAQKLLQYGCCIFHAVSFVFRGRAWLLTAPPGTGKTTQFLNWQRLHPGEITMISGDLPVLEGRGDGSVWVYPTSWNGKEDIGSRISAPLGGIIVLEQGSEDRIAPLPTCESVRPLFRQFMVQLETEEEILALARLLEQALTAAPCWKMINRGGDESTELLRRTVIQYLEKEEST